MNLDLESSDQSDQEPPTDSSTKNNSQKTGGENEARNGQQISPLSPNQVLRRSSLSRDLSDLLWRVTQPHISHASPTKDSDSDFLFSPGWN